jgi:hypothetical protein
MLGIKSYDAPSAQKIAYAPCGATFNKKRNLPSPCGVRANKKSADEPHFFSSGRRDWDRTNDLHDVNVAL